MSQFDWMNRTQPFNSCRGWLPQLIELGDLRSVKYATAPKFLETRTAMATHTLNGFISASPRSFS